jgi:hypothetical protein
MSDSYWRLILRDAANHWRGETFDHWGRRLIGYIVESAVLFLILLKLPFLGDMQGEERLAIAGALAAIGGGALLFLFDLVTAPKRLHQDMQKRLMSRHDIILNFWEAERKLRILDALQTEGRAIYRDLSDIERYEARFNAWDTKVVSVLKDKFSITALYEYQNSYTGVSGMLGGYYTLENAAAGWEEKSQSLLARFSARLEALVDMIKHGGGVYVGPVLAIREMLHDEDFQGLQPLAIQETLPKV